MQAIKEYGIINIHSLKLRENLEKLIKFRVLYNFILKETSLTSSDIFTRSVVKNLEEQE